VTNYKCGVNDFLALLNGAGLFLGEFYLTGKWEKTGGLVEAVNRQ
jgi:hypothetical protein